MPVLETLDLSDNPIGDGGISSLVLQDLMSSDECFRSLIPYFSQTGEHYSLANLNLKNCMLSCDGVTELLEVLTKLKYTLTSLSIADNHPGSENRGGIQTAEFLAKLIPQAPDLISVNAGYNLMPLESIGIFCSALQVARGMHQGYVLRFDSV
ncbi:hypothetical protein Ancab_033716 [Ancistrocladus abbreviatus]